MAFGLAMVWAHPYQAYLSSLDEVARKLTLLINLTDNWAYTFVWLNEDAQHVPLSNKGHISTMVDGVPCRNVCRHLCQLEVQRLLQYGDQVVYPEGLNRGLEPVLTLLSGTLTQGMAQGASPSARAEDPRKLTATSQVSPWAAMPDNSMLTNQTPEVASTPTTPPTKTPSGSDTGTLPKEVI